MAAHLTPPVEADDEDQPLASGNSYRGPLTLLVAATILYFAQEILVPLAVAGLLSFILSPPMLWLRRHYVPRAPAALAVVLLAFAVIFGFGSVVAGEMVTVVKELPTYQYNVVGKLQNLQQAIPLRELSSRSTQFLDQIRSELLPATPRQSATPAKPTGTGEQIPVPVEIKQGPSVLGVFEYVAGPVLRPLATAGLVFVFVIFFLLYREDLRDRFIRLVGARDLHRATQMMNDAVERLSRYLVMELSINAIYGLLMGIGTFLIGLPNAALWGVLFLVLRFVPYFGTWVAALFPLALSIAVAPGWTMFFETFGLFIAIEMLVANAVEPLLFGASTGLSPVAVLVAATFWTWLWGPIGLVLSTPLTACLAVMGRYAPPLRFLVVLLGQEAPLAAEETFYQRLLAADAAEAAEQAETYLRSGTLESFYDTVVIPALVMAEEDCERGVLKRDKRVQIRDAITEMIESLEESETPPAMRRGVPPVFCLGARNELDEAAALLLADALNRRGLAAHASAAQQWINESRGAGAALHERSTPPILCVSHLGAAPASRARLIIRRLRRHCSAGTRILLCLWATTTAITESNEDATATIGADKIPTTIDTTVAEIAGLLLPPDASTDEREAALSESEAETR
jgi:predicted PurR-regulated permease PerM